MITRLLAKMNKESLLKNKRYLIKRLSNRVKWISIRICRVILRNRNYWIPKCSRKGRQ